jgi:tetratricopeptide (TPR) repeat protein
VRSRLIEVPSGTLLLPLEPATGPRGNPAAAVEALAGGVKGAIAYQFGTIGPAVVGRPVPYEAYREFGAGMAAAGFDWQATVAHTRKAVEITPDFWMARLRLAMAYFLMRQPNQAREMLASVESAKARLAPGEQLFLDFVKARMERRRLDALKAASAFLELTPGDPILSYTAAELALGLNRPRAALNALGDLSALDWRNLAKWSQGTWFIRVSALAHHFLGEHEEELADAQLGVQYYPSSQRTYENLVRVYAALGKLDEVERAIAASLAIPPDNSGSPGTVMLEAAEELRCHGRADEAVRVALRCDRWYADHPPKDAEGAISAANRAEVLWVAQRWAEAKAAAEQFARESPASVHAPGLLGVMAARAGDRATATECDARLAKFEPPAKGTAQTWRAAIAAQFGEKERAVDLLRDAFAKGEPFGNLLHTRDYIEPLQGYPPLEELLKPQG